MLLSRYVQINNWYICNLPLLDSVFWKFCFLGSSSLNKDWEIGRVMAALGAQCSCILGTEISSPSSGAVSQGMGACSSGNTQNLCCVGKRPISYRRQDFCASLNIFLKGAEFHSLSVASLPAEPSLAVCSASFVFKQHKTSCQHSTDCMASGVAGNSENP